MNARVIGIGQAAAGDDGVGRAVVRYLRNWALPDRVELVETDDPSALLWLLEGADPVIIVDAVVDVGRPGTVLHLEANDLEPGGSEVRSTHGLGVGWAIELIRTVAPGRLPGRIEIVAVSIAPPAAVGEGLSPAVAAAVPRAAEEVACILESATWPSVLASAV